MGRGVWQATIHRIAESDRTEGLAIYDPAIPLLGMYLEKTII